MWIRTAAHAARATRRLAAVNMMARALPMPLSPRRHARGSWLEMSPPFRRYLVPEKVAPLPSPSPSASSQEQPASARAGAGATGGNGAQRGGFATPVNGGAYYTPRAASDGALSLPPTSPGGDLGGSGSIRKRPAFRSVRKAAAKFTGVHGAFSPKKCIR